MERAWDFELPEGASGDEPGSFEIGFSDEIAYEREDVIEHAERFLNGLEGVACLWEDRERFVCRSTLLRVAEVEDRFANFWAEVVKAQPAWSTRIADIIETVAPVFKASGFKKRGGVFTRDCDDDVVHIVDIAHVFDSDEDGKRISKVVVDCAIYLPLVEELMHPGVKRPVALREFHATIRTVFYATRLTDLADDVYIEVATDALAAFDGLTTLEQIARELEAPTREIASMRTSYLKALVFFALGRSDDAAVALRDAYDERIPLARDSLLSVAQRLMPHAITTSSFDRRISVREVELLRQWASGHEARLREIERLVAALSPPKKRRFRLGAPKTADLDFSIASLQHIDALLTTSMRQPVAAALSGSLPILGSRFFEVTGPRIADVTGPGYQWLARMGELIASYVAEIVAREVDDCWWGIAGSGGLGIAGPRLVHLMQFVMNHVLVGLGEDPDVVPPSLTTRVTWFIDDITSAPLGQLDVVFKDLPVRHR